MPTKSYAYSIGNVRAKEVSLLKRQDLEQMLGFKTTKEMVAFLREKGFGNISDSLLPDILKSETAKAWEYIRSVAPDFSLFTAFIIPNDYHNLKATLKGIVKGKDFENLLVTPCLVKTTDLKDAVSKKDFSKLPEYMKDAANRAYDAFVKAGDVQLSDGILDASCMEAQIKFASETKNEFLKRLINTEVFFNNFKIAIRAARAKKNSEFLESCLIKDDIIDKKALKKAALMGESEVLTLLETKTALDGDKAAEAYNKNPLEYERFVENYIMKIAREGKYVVMGAEALIGYLLARLCEIKAVRIIANGIATGLSEEEIRGMLRELYG